MASGDTNGAAPPAAPFTYSTAEVGLTPRRSWLRGLDLNQRPLGYEGNAIRDRHRNVQKRNESATRLDRRV